MSHELPYESSSRSAEGIWPALRIGVVIYAAGIIMRHAIYWTMIATTGRSAAAMGLAIAESALLLYLAVLVVQAKTMLPSVMRWLAAVSVGIILIHLVAFAYDAFVLVQLRDRAGIPRLAWAGVGRVPMMAIPIVLILVSARLARR